MKETNTKKITIPKELIFFDGEVLTKYIDLHKKGMSRYIDMKCVKRYLK